MRQQLDIINMNLNLVLKWILIVSHGIDTLYNINHTKLFQRSPQCQITNSLYHCIKAEMTTKRFVHIHIAKQCINIA